MKLQEKHLSLEEPTDDTYESIGWQGAKERGKKGKRE